MRLIDADELIWRLAYYYFHSYGKAEYAYGVAAEEVNKLPTIDAVPVVHGRWLEHPDDRCSLFNGWECSECKQIVSGGKGNYCPNCGAKMDAKEVPEDGNA